MKDQPWDLNQTWPVGRKWCRFKNVPLKFLRLFPKFWAQKLQILDHFSATSALDTAYLRNETSHRQSKMLIQCTICPLKVDLLSVTFAVMLVLVLVLVLKDFLRTITKSLSLSWSLIVRSWSLSLTAKFWSLSWSL